MALSPGDTVPAFTLLRGHADPVASTDLFAAGPTLVHFWPFSYSGSVAEGKGCEAQVCSFGARAAELERAGVQLVGVSADSPFVQKAWKAKLEQPYPFLSDLHWEAADAFGVKLEEGFGTYRPMATRAAFVVDTAGVVRYAEVGEPTVIPNVAAAVDAAIALAS